VVFLLATFIIRTKSYGDDGFIFSVLRRSDSVFASTNVGLYQASLSDKIWHKLPVPSSMPMNGSFAQESAPSSVLVYYTGTFLPIAPSKVRFTVFVSKDLGQTWTQTSSGVNFLNLSITQNGILYGEELLETEDVPQEGPSEWTTSKDGKRTYLVRHVVMSRDLGKTWNDISGNIPQGYDYSFFPDVEHPDLICLEGNESFHPMRTIFFQADDQSYQWKNVPEDLWRGVVTKNDSFFGSISPGNSNEDARASLSTYFVYPFFKWGNGIDVQSVQVETAKPAYSFHLGQPMPVPITVRVLFPRSPLKFLDNKDETLFWLLRALPEDGKGVFGGAKVTALYVNIPDRDAIVKQYLADPNLLTITLDEQHPYKRVVDMAKLYNFTKPGKYQVQFMKALANFVTWDAGFDGEVIDLTVTN
jgi:hypothetical protein